MSSPTIVEPEWPFFRHDRQGPVFRSMAAVIIFRTQSRSVSVVSQWCLSGVALWCLMSHQAHKSVTKTDFLDALFSA